MHNAAFKKLGLDYKYELMSVHPKKLESHVSTKLYLSNFGGANVTIPHKITIIKHLDKVDTNAARIGAVNTIVKKEGMLMGFNTDGIGAVRALSEVYKNMNDAKVLLIGAGGAARSVGYYLSQIVREIIISNRTNKRANELTSSLKLNPECNSEVKTIPYVSQALREALDNATILINGTSLGMYPQSEETPIPKDMLHSDLLVFDMVYNPIKTKLLRDAEDVGASVLSGISMLVYQGAASFKMWTEKDAPLDIMRSAVETTLGEK